jgi:protein-tyrosine phosphatase
MPRPRGGDWLSDEIGSLKASGVDVVISLLEPEELSELDVEEEAALCRVHGIDFLSFPIPDRGVPPNRAETLHFVRKVAALLTEEKSVVIYCRHGIGRSALVAACVLALGGLPVDEAFAMVENARCCPVPDTPEQRAWVASFAEELTGAGTGIGLLSRDALE